MRIYLLPCVHTTTNLDFGNRLAWELILAALCKHMTSLKDIRFDFRKPKTTKHEIKRQVKHLFRENGN